MPNPFLRLACVAGRARSIGSFYSLRAPSRLWRRRRAADALSAFARHGACAARTGVALHLVCTWQNRFPGDDIEYRLLPARADRQVGRAGAPVRERGEHLLDDAILERVVADDRDPAARVEPADSGIEAAPKHVELAVHLDAQRLERALRRMPPALRAEAGMAALMMATSCSLVSMGAVCRARTANSAIRLAHFSSE